MENINWVSSCLLATDLLGNFLNHPLLSWIGCGVAMEICVKSITLYFFYFLQGFCTFFYFLLTLIWTVPRKDCSHLHYWTAFPLLFFHIWFNPCLNMLYLETTFPTRSRHSSRAWNNVFSETIPVPPGCFLTLWDEAWISVLLTTNFSTFDKCNHSMLYLGMDKGAQVSLKRCTCKQLESNIKASQTWTYTNIADEVGRQALEGQHFFEISIIFGMKFDFLLLFFTLCLLEALKPNSCILPPSVLGECRRTGLLGQQGSGEGEQTYPDMVWICCA